MKRNQFLAGLLAAQAVIVVIVLFSGKSLQSHSGIEKLLDVQLDKLDKIVIEDLEGNVARLVKSGDTWMTEDQFPVDSDRVSRLLEDMNDLDHGLAVANSANAAQRFKVSRENYERHVQLISGDKPVAEFYLGTGAGARRNHIRLAGQDSIYAAELAVYTVPSEIGDWQDKTQLQLDKDSITRIEVDGLTFSRAATEEGNEAAWSTENLAEDESIDSDTLDTQLGNLADLRYNRAFSGSVDEFAATSGPVREITINYGDGSRTYRFFNAKEEDSFILKVSDKDELFEISQYNGNQITENLSAETLIQKPEESSEDVSDSSSMDSVQDEPETDPGF